MTDRVARQVDGYEIVTSGSLVCPSADLCDIGVGETYEEYVYRHAGEHNLGDFEKLADAERNLGLWCFYFDHKYNWGNPELHPYPHWEIHSFVAEPEWSEADLQSRIPLTKRRAKGYLPPADKRRAGEYRRFKQCEVPRQCQKTSIGARAYSVFRSKHEYFVNDRKNYRIIVRSATTKNTRDTLAVIRRMSTKSRKIASLYGVTLNRCGKCGSSFQLQVKLTECPTCGSVRHLSHRRLSLMNDTQGSGSTGKDQLSFRWLTDAYDADAVAAYSIWVAGLKTETTGQRPDLYIWDDPQTEDNSDTVEKRSDIAQKFDGSWRELQFSGEMLVFDTRKYVNDFASKIQVEPLASMFHALRREVGWRTDEPDNAPWVVDGWRYYYPVKGDGQRALDAEEVAKLKKQRNFSAEYMNNPVDEETAKFKRSDFIIVSRSENRADWPEGQRELVPPEVRYGLGRTVTTTEQKELDDLRVRINAVNACDPAGEKASKTGDDNFIVATRQDRHGRIFITRLAAGRWGTRRRFDEVEKASTYNMARTTSYELPVNEEDTKEAFEKWVRDTSDERSLIFGHPVTVRPPIDWESMPKSTKDSRIDAMEAFLPIYILDDAAEPDLIEKYTAQWVGRGVEDHDDGPDATSRLIRFFSGSRYRPPEPEEEDSWVDPQDGAAYVPFAHLKALAERKPEGRLWGERGRANG